MPQAVAVAAIGAAGAFGGAAMQSRAAGKASSAQERATREALALERERDRAKSQRYEAAMEDYKRRHAQYTAMKRAYYSKYYGIDLPEEKQPAQLSSGAGRGPVTMLPGAAPAPAARPAAPPSALLAPPPSGGGVPPMFDSQQSGPMSSAPMDEDFEARASRKWSDWGNYA